MFQLYLCSLLALLPICFSLSMYVVTFVLQSYDILFCIFSLCYLYSLVFENSVEISHISKILPLTVLIIFNISFLFFLKAFILLVPLLTIIHI